MERISPGIRPLLPRLSGGKARRKRMGGAESNSVSIPLWRTASILSTVELIPRQLHADRFGSFIIVVAPAQSRLRDPLGPATRFLLAEAARNRGTGNRRTRSVIIGGWPRSSVLIPGSRGSVRRIAAALGERRRRSHVQCLTGRRETLFVPPKVFLIMFIWSYRNVLSHAGAMRVTIW